MKQLSSTALTGQNITGPLLVATFVADKVARIMAQIHLDGLIGNGTYRACLTKQIGGSGTAYQSSTAGVSVSVGCATAFLATVDLAVNVNDVVKIYVQGLAVDTSVDGAVEIWDVSTAAATEAADELLLRDWTAISDTVPERSALNALRFLRNRWAAEAGVLTVYQEDDETVAWTSLLTTNAGAAAITGVAPQGGEGGGGGDLPA